MVTCEGGLPASSSPTVHTMVPHFTFSSPLCSSQSCRAELSGGDPVPGGVKFDGCWMIDYNSKV